VLSLIGAHQTDCEIHNTFRIPAPEASQAR